MTMIQKVIFVWMLMLVGILIVPLMSIAAVLGITYDIPSTATTVPVNIAEQRTPVEANDFNETVSQSIAGGQARSFLDLLGGFVAAKTAPEIIEGTKVYRVWGGKSGAWGESWTTVNPNIVPNLRSAAGLPDVNAGRFVSEGVLQSTEGVTSRGALIIKSGQQGGLPELVIKGAEQKVLLQRVSGVNPQF